MFTNRSLSNFLVMAVTAMWAIAPLASAKGLASLLGEWKATGEVPNSDPSESTLIISVEGDKIKAVSIGSDEKERVIDQVKIEGGGKVLRLELKLESNGQTGTIRVEAEHNEDGKLDGEWALLDSNGDEVAKAPWSAIRLSQPESKSDDARSSSSIVGKWNSVATTNNDEELESVVTISGTGKKLGGKTVSERSETTFESVAFDGKTVEIEMVLKFNDNELDTRIEAELKGEDTLDGKWVIFNDAGEEAATGPWKATRALELDLAGTWSVVAATNDGENTHEASFEKTASGYQGAVEGETGNAAFTEVVVTGNDVKLSLPFGEGTVKIAATYSAKNKLTGKWTYLDSSDAELASNDWIATRNVPKKAAPSVVGDWGVSLIINDNERGFDLTIQETDAGLKGSVDRPTSRQVRARLGHLRERSTHVEGHPRSPGQRHRVCLSRQDD